VGVESVGPELLQRGVDDILLVLRAHEMRPATQSATQPPEILRAHPPLKARLIRALQVGALGCEPVQAARVRLRPGGDRPARTQLPPLRARAWIDPSCHASHHETWGAPCASQGRRAVINQPDRSSV
jgi:hypothetical protein